MKNHLRVLELSLAEILASLSYALDLTGGNPMGHSQRTCLIAMKLGAMYGLTEGQLTSLYYSALLKDCGCSSNAARMYEIFGADELKVKSKITIVDKTNLMEAARFIGGNVMPGKSLLARAARTLELMKNPNVIEATIETRCTRGRDIALTLGLGLDAARSIYSLMERWDGNGGPEGLRGDDIPILARINNVAQHVEAYARSYGVDTAFDLVQNRRGKSFDPEIIDLLMHSRQDHVLWDSVQNDPRTELLGLDVRPVIEKATEERIDSICDVFAQIVDAKSPYTAEHSWRVRDYALVIADGLGYQGERRVTIRRAALLHDLGKLAVPNSILDKPGGLDDDEWVCVKKHPYYTQEILAKIPSFARITEIAAAHHERLDGLGYFRGLGADNLDIEMRLLAVADVFDALSAKRPYREALPLDEVFSILDKQAGVALDVRCIDILKSSTSSLDDLRNRAETNASTHLPVCIRQAA